MGEEVPYEEALGVGDMWGRGYGGGALQNTHIRTNNYTHNNTQIHTHFNTPTHYNKQIHTLQHTRITTHKQITNTHKYTHITTHITTHKHPQVQRQVTLFLLGQEFVDQRGGEQRGSGFPGSQPVSLDLQSIEKLKQVRYVYV